MLNWFKGLRLHQQVMFAGLGITVSGGFFTPKLIFAGLIVLVVSLCMWIGDLFDG